MQFFPANITVISYFSQFWASLIAEEDEQFGAYFQGFFWQLWGSFWLQKPLKMITYMECPCRPYIVYFLEGISQHEIILLMSFIARC